MIEKIKPLRKKERILIAVAWPYANGYLHLGHLAGPAIASDIIARYYRLKGKNVLMVSGSDMHGTPITVTAEKENTTPKKVASKYHKAIVKLYKDLGLSFDNYTSTATETHKKAVQEIFLKLLEKKYIFEDETLQAYCETDKRFLPDRYIEGICPFCGFANARGDQCDECGHTLDPTELIDPKCKFCGNKPVFRPTKHFFLDLPLFQTKLENYLEKQKHWRPSVREFSASWLREGLKPRAITRDLPYGIPVPLKGYPSKVIYVWFEAVLGYYSATLEWGEKTKKEKEASSFWHDNAKHLYFMGKDNIPFHTVILPAILLGYGGLNLPYDVLANEYLTYYGKQMSKSRNWLVDAQDTVDKYGVTAVRFYISANMPENHDTDFTWESFESSNNNELVATIGNFINRTLTFAAKNFEGKVPNGKLDKNVNKQISNYFNSVENNLNKVKIGATIKDILSLAKFGNQYFDQNTPWKTIKDDKENTGNIIYNCIQIISALTILLTPILPQATDEISHTLGITNDKWEIKEVTKNTLLKDIKIYFPKIDVYPDIPKEL